MDHRLFLAQWLRSRTSLCREGWYYLMIMVLVFAGAMIKEVNLLLLLGGMMLGPLLFNWRAVHLTLKGLELQRKSPQAVCAGDPLTVGMRLINKRKHFGSWAVTVEEQIHRQSDAAHNHSLWNHAPKEKTLKTTVYFPYVPAGQERTGTYRGRLFERGKYELGPVRISTRFPFGLFSRTISVLQKDTLYVYPRLGRLTRNWLARHRRRWPGPTAANAVRDRRAISTASASGAAATVMRYIHWRSSARTGKLVVRQFEQPRNRDVAILLGPLAAGKTDRRGARERRTGGQFRGHGSKRPLPPRRKQSASGDSQRETALPRRPGGGRAAARYDENPRRAREPRRRLPAGALGSCLESNRLGHGDHSGFHAAGRFERCREVSNPCFPIPIAAVSQATSAPSTRRATNCGIFSMWRKR